MTNDEEQQHTCKPGNLGDAWTQFEIDIAETDAARLDDMKSCFYSGVLALLAVIHAACETAPEGKTGETVADALNAAERETRAFFNDDEIPDGPITLKVLTVEAVTADELVAKVREVLPLTPEHEAEIRKMHAARAARIAKQH
ncbi:hypothetical protein ACS7SF_02695 [Ralstonia sp. 25C]|uniref:hypothetical protein n=1 Tax=Ralstonia sp. 25C TaxID=3447363 RepID=UPI003F74E79C